ncbi:cytochrome c biogenesis CcdA family protein [Propionimicrobium lymphophilum]|uniref:cytochrome c biogenesis CcdA family protein n=1 Tax=Propionimicrobium lymphophilum TaxID=33012 RepID=UPI0023F20D68|nr:cytochrome c biogenesis CcdA family protein [Propionimicrobium lymphophilum]
MNIGFAAAFLGGIAAVFSPCSAMLLPSFFAIAFGARLRTLLGRVGIFYIGSLLTLVPLGLAAGTMGTLLAEHRQTISLVGGIVLIVIGLCIVFGFSLPIPGLRARGGSSALSVLVLGMVYGLSGTCTGPLLGAILTMAAISSSPLYGAFLLAIFAAGMAVPLAILALLWDKVDLASKLRPRVIKIGPFETTLWAIVSGLLFVGLGVLFLASDATGALGGLLDAGAQQQLEISLGKIASCVPDIVVLILLVVVISLLAWLAVSRTSKQRN